MVYVEEARPRKMMRYMTVALALVSMLGVAMAERYWTRRVVLLLQMGRLVKVSTVIMEMSATMSVPVLVIEVSPALQDWTWTWM